MLRRLNITTARYAAVSVALALAITLQQTPRLQAQTTGCGQPTPGFPSVVTCAGPGTYTWTVPDNVTQVTFDVLGAQGGCMDNSSVEVICGPRNNAPGKGGEAKATLSVHPHDTFQINVGGASDVRAGPFRLEDRLIVAGGGGGGGWYGGGGGSYDGEGGEGGGGGSGYAIPSATNASLTSGVQTGDGRVTITYQAIFPFCPTSVSNPFSSVCPAAGAAAGNPGQAEITSAEPSTNGPAASGPGSNSLGIQATPNTVSGLQGCSGSLGNAIPSNGGGPTAGPGTAAGNLPSGPQVCFDTFGDQIPCASGAGVGSPFGGGGNPFSPFGP